MDFKVELLLACADSLRLQFEQVCETRYIDAAIILGRAVLDICTSGHTMRSSSLSQLSFHLWTRYNQFGRLENLEEAIVLNREALALRPPGHPDRSMSLNNLAHSIYTRYTQLGAVRDLDEAIFLDRDALALYPLGHPDRPSSLNNLALHLCTRYKQIGSVKDLNEALSLARDALEIHMPGHPHRTTSLNNLAHHLFTRYKQLGGVEDLDEAIILDREALALRPPEHPNRSMSLNNLASFLFARYKRLGGVDDLNEAIALAQDSLTLRPPGHPDRSMALNNLGIDLLAHHKQFGGIEELEKAVVLARDVLVLCPQGHPDRSMSLDNLAHHLYTRYQRLGAVGDLDEAIILDRDALALRPLGHPDRSGSLTNLAGFLSARHKQLGKIEDLNGAIFLARDALALRPSWHPDRTMALNNLALYLVTRHKQMGKPEDREELFDLYADLQLVSQTLSSRDLSAVKAWINAAEDFQHPTTILAYETALRFLTQHLTALPLLPKHLVVLKALTSSLAVEAFSTCLRNHCPTKAVELLEQGRGVFWSQLTRLRSPLDDVVASGSEGKILADEFSRLTSLIRDALNSPSTDQHDRICHLNSELQRVVSSIRSLPTLSRFLLPPFLTNLRHAAKGGPVIVVNASKFSCDALIIFVDKDPFHIPLSISKEDVQGWSSKLHTLTVLAKGSDITKDLGLILRQLWDHVVSPIADFLRKIYPCQSRIWWCPTAEFTLLPIHAAGPYRKGQLNFADLYISSYTPTLTALIRAQRDCPLDPAIEWKGFLGLGQARASGESELHCVSTELVNIGHRVDGLATFARIEGQDCCISRVTNELGKYQWVHLACHGLPNRGQPLESAFALHDGHFTIQRIMQCELENPEFAYLSACHTTVGDEESPDEMIHLASAMQFAGFRSVIGTMWAVDDAETNKITSVFYQHMVDRELGRLDHTRAAFALWKTMRSVNVPLDQRILYIHIGA